MLSLPLRTPRDIGAVIRSRRKSLGFTQSELATRVGAQRLWLGQVEAGHPGASLGLVLRTLKELGLEIAVSEPQGFAEASAPDINAIVDAARDRGRP